ncbi:MAG: PilZ domain-containing protein [Hyphomicrobiaceae bacterium]
MPPAGSPRRKRPRFAVDRAVKIHVGNSTMLARILDISAGGARIRCATSDWMPAQIEVEDAKGGRYRATVEWRGKSVIGVRWLDGGPPLPSSAVFGRRERK